jgi:hypothetical protein
MDLFSSKELLAANPVNAIALMVIFIIIGIVAVVRILAPIMQANTAALNSLGNVIVGQTASNDKQTAEIAALRQDFNAHTVQINLRLDQLPKEFQAILGAEFARQSGTLRRPNPNVSIMSRILGLN